jgi:hypothetical protein
MALYPMRGQRAIFTPVIPDYHIPSELVVDEWGPDVGSSSPLDFLLLHNLETRFVA